MITAEQARNLSKERQLSEWTIKHLELRISRAASDGYTSLDYIPKDSLDFDLIISKLKEHGFDAKRSPYKDYTILINWG